MATAINELVESGRLYVDIMNKLNNEKIDGLKLMIIEYSHMRNQAIKVGADISNCEKKFSNIIQKYKELTGKNISNIGLEEYQEELIKKIKGVLQE